MSELPDAIRVDADSLPLDDGEYYSAPAIRAEIERLTRAGITAGRQRDRAREECERLEAERETAINNLGDLCSVDSLTGATTQAAIRHDIVKTALEQAEADVEAFREVSVDRAGLYCKICDGWNVSLEEKHEDWCPVLQPHPGQTIIEERDRLREFVEHVSRGHSESKAGRHGKLLNDSQIAQQRAAWIDEITRKAAALRGEATEEAPVTETPESLMDKSAYHSVRAASLQLQARQLDEDRKRATKEEPSDA